MWASGALRCKVGASGAFITGSSPCMVSSASEGHWELNQASRQLGLRDLRFELLGFRFLRFGFRVLGSGAQWTILNPKDLSYWMSEVGFRRVCSYD